MKYINASVFFFLSLLMIVGCQNEPSKIDRYALVNRHNIIINGYDSLNSLSVGNGNFAFTTGLTGLQTFHKAYENGVPLGTQSNWGWHTVPNTNNYNREESERYYDYQGRKVPYLHKYRKGRKSDVSDYFRENPHKLHLGMIGLVLIKENGEPVALEDIENAKHSLNLWEGKISSLFVVEGDSVKVELYCHQEMDMISVKIQSELIEKGQLGVSWKYSYGIPENTHPGYDFNASEMHVSKLVDKDTNSALVKRILDKDIYFVKIQWNTSATFNQEHMHDFQLQPDGQKNSLEYSCLFSPDSISGILPTFAETEESSRSGYKDFWLSGGAIDFSACSDSRAAELERRTVLSQYLTKIQSSGSLPPAETGLTYNSWYGKFHLEMHLWHAAHFPVWNRSQLLENQMPYYEAIYDKALLNAARQEFKGIRWPKMVGPHGDDSPSNVGVYLIWQQPHYIYYAEQLYLAEPNESTLKKYGKLVKETADFMADFAVKDSVTGIYNLLPPLIPAQEHWDKITTTNPPFELAYWYWGLTTAQKWLERQGLPKNEKWEEVRLNLAAPTVMDSVYLGIANAPESYTDPENMTDHPMVLGALGILPDWDKMDPDIMRNTLDVIMQKWDWPSTWGWDYPMVAMCATRLGEPEIAIDALLMDVQKNTYLKNGHNYQSGRLRIYLPGNGGFLKTMALMCAGWEGCDTKNPGFPKDGNWEVKWENLNPDF